MGAAGAPTGTPMAPKGGAEGATPPEGEENPAEGKSSRVYTNTVLDGCVILFVRYRNHFPVVQFQN